MRVELCMQNYPVYNFTLKSNLYSPLNCLKILQKVGESVIRDAEVSVCQVSVISAVVFKCSVLVLPQICA